MKHFSSTVSTDVYSGYDLLGNQLYAHYGSASGAGIDYTWDALGRKLTETSYGRTVSSQYDLNGNRTRLTWPDGNYVQYTYDALNRMQQVLQNGATPVLAAYAYDNLSRVAGIGRPNSTATSMSYSTTALDWSLAQDMSGNTQDVTFGLSFTPANQVSSRTISNPIYAYSAPSLTQAYVSNGLNQYTSVGGPPYYYDDRGNLTSDGGRSFSYDLENHLLGVSGTYSISLAYDPRGRMQQSTATSTEQYLYDGDDLIAEYDTSGNILRRYVPGRGTDEFLVWYEGGGLSTPNWLHTDQQGSVIAASNGAGAATTYVYDPTGIPASWGASPPTPIFRYTGQVMLPAVKLYYYKARIYDPTLGRFLQTDPIGYKDEYNLYTYSDNDPINQFDPTGLDSWIISRNVYTNFFGINVPIASHTFIVVAESYGSKPEYQFSYGPSEDSGQRLVELSSHLNNFTPQADLNAYYGKDTSARHTKIDAPDKDVIAEGRKLDEQLESNPIKYAAQPSKPDEGNSNSATARVADDAQTKSGSNKARPYPNVALPPPGQGALGGPVGWLHQFTFCSSSSESRVCPGN